MDILKILQAVQSGTTTPDEALSALKFSPFEELMDGVNVDRHRALRTGQGECVFAAGKTIPRLLLAMEKLSGPECTEPVLATRVSPEQGEALLKAFPAGEFWPEARLFCLGKNLAPLGLASPWPTEGEAMIITAGASDLPIALEALGTALFYGLKAGLAPDIGVAGIHRIKPWLSALDKAKVLIVIAGMEGALPSVLAGLTSKPVLAVPASVGYGVSHGGFVALASMLSSCAPGISVFNIDNGYGAALFACRLLNQFRHNENATHAQGRTDA